MPTLRNPLPVPEWRSLTSGVAGWDLILGTGSSRDCFLYLSRDSVCHSTAGKRIDQSFSGGCASWGTQDQQRKGLPVRVRACHLIRTPSTGEYRAFTAVCTHLGCTVQYRPDLQEIWCPCHNGIYDLQGRNVSGPPPRPLAQYQVHIQGQDIVVVRNA